jgi:formylglycine-generating enzyme required for sulfatase activity
VAYARRAGVDPTKTLDLGSGVKLELVLIPAGKFLMGTPETEEGRGKEPQHEVTLTKPYHLGKYEVTQEQYQQVMGTNQSQFKGRDLPAEMVSWDDAQEFCKKASGKTGLAVRLPTDAEWEYACRAGTKTSYYTGDSEADLGRAGWYFKNSSRTTHPVGHKTANAWGLYDMHGSVLEWCADWTETYKAEAAIDPQGSAQGALRVARGGCWDLDPVHCRSASVFGLPPDFRFGLLPPNDRALDCGFRVVVESALKTP